ncbi:MAG: hypothetical protein A4S09_10685 [Proteobacteria bacterium SG_bin7]|nr:MAG: hypothetical protein A4S09_10685 [Proteobacteria bacterium SG_bin7]
MKKAVLIYLISIVGIAASAQSNVDNSSYYRDRNPDKIPVGTQVRFLVDIIIPYKETSANLSLKRHNCMFRLDDSLAQPFDQVIATGTTQPVSNGNTWGVSLSGTQAVYLYCANTEFKTVGELVDAFSGAVAFEFPEPQKPKAFKFP